MASLADLPEDVVLRILELCAIEDALILTQTCKAIYSLSTTRSFWLSVVSSLRRRRPVPVDDRIVDAAGLRSATLESLRVHHKLSVRHNVAPIRHTTFPSVMEKEQFGREHRSPWVILLKDGKRILQIIRQVILVRDIRTTELLAQIPLHGDVQSLGHQLTDQGIFLTLCLWHPWGNSNCSVEIWHIDKKICIIQQPLDFVPLDLVIYECSSYYTVEPNQEDTVLLYISDWKTLATSVYDISAAFPEEALSATVSVTPTQILLHLALQTETRIASFPHTYFPSHIHTSSMPSPCLNCPVLSPEWTLCSPFGPKPLWTLMNTVWDGRIGLTISALPSTHASGMSQEILLCQFDAEVPQSGKANLEGGLVSRRTEVMEGPDGRHVLNPGRYGKTVAWCNQKNSGSGSTELPEFFFADRRGTDPDDPAEAESVFSKYSTCDDGYKYRFNPPPWVARHGSFLDMDFDDARGRLALAMEDDTTVLFEF